MIKDKKREGGLVIKSMKGEIKWMEVNYKTKNGRKICDHPIIYLNQS